MSERIDDELTCLLEQSQTLSAQIGRLRSAGESIDALVAQHRMVSSRIGELRAAREVSDPEGEKDTGGPQISVVTSASDFLALRDEWNELLDDSVAPTPFLRWEWLYSWWEVFGADRQLRIVIVREARDGALIGLAPMMLGLRERGRLRRRVLAFIGTGEVAEGDYFTLIARRGREDQAIDWLWRGLLQLAGEYDRISLCDVCTADPILLGLVARATTDRRSVFIDTRRQSVLGPLPASFEEFIASVPDKQRRNYLRDMDRHFRTQGLSVEYSTAGTETEIGEALRAIADFSIARQQGKGRRSAWRDPTFVDFMQRACLRLHERREVQADALRHDGKILAALLGFAHEGTYFCYQMGFGAGAASVSPLHHLLGRTLRACVERGFVGFDFLAGEHEYKTQYFAGRRPVGHLAIWDPGRGRGRGSGSGGVQVAARLLGQEVRQRVKAWIRSQRHSTAHTGPHG